MAPGNEKTPMQVPFRFWRMKGTPQGVLGALTRLRVGPAGLDPWSLRPSRRTMVTLWGRSTSEFFGVIRVGRQHSFRLHIGMILPCEQSFGTPHDRVDDGLGRDES